MTEMRQDAHSTYHFVCLRCGLPSARIFETSLARDDWYDDHLLHTGHDKGRQRWVEHFNKGVRVA